MKDVGQKLAKKRKELKLSYDDVCQLTKLPLATIKAIEAGDLDHFQNDLTYVRFYVRSYCKAIDVPYENFKEDVLESVEEYTTTLSMKLIKEHEQINENIVKKSNSHKEVDIDLPEEKMPKLAKRDRVSIAQNAQQSHRFRKAKRVDLVSLSLGIVVVVVIVSILFVGVSTLFDKGTTPPIEEPGDQVEDTTPPVEKEDDKKENRDEETKTDSEKDSKVVFTKREVNSYEISGIKSGETITIEITFKQSGQFNMWKGNAVVPNAYNMYEANATYKYENTVTAQEMLTLNFWNYGGATIKVNGKSLDYDESAQIAKDGVTYITLITKGE